MTPTHQEALPFWLRAIEGVLDEPSPYSYGAGEPAAGVVPFSAESKWNTKIPAGPPVAAESAAVVTWLNSLGGPVNTNLGVGGTAEDFSKPIYYTAEADPQVYVKTAGIPPNGIYTAAANIPTSARVASAVSNKLIRVPAAAAAAGGSDGHMVIQGKRYAVELYKVGFQAVGAGMISCRGGGVFDLQGNGTPIGFSAATASGCSTIAGPIRLPELEAGVINHAIAIVVKPEVRRKLFRAPANGIATPIATGVEGDEADLKRPITGSRLQLNYSQAEIQALAVPAWKKTILEAMRVYGMIIVDTGGASFGCVFESGAPDVANGKPDRWIAWAKAQGIEKEAGFYPIPLKSTVDWTKLRVVEV